MKEVRVCEAMKSPVGTLSDGTVLHQQDGGTKSRQVPIWEKSNTPNTPYAIYANSYAKRYRSDKGLCRDVNGMAKINPCGVE